VRAAAGADTRAAHADTRHNILRAALYCHVLWRGAELHAGGWQGKPV
jgi:hypothetical protein